MIMKKITLFLLLFIAFNINAQSYSTGLLTLNAINGSSLGYSAKIDINATQVKLTLVGASTKWMGIGFGATSMTSGTGDVVIFNGTDLTDRHFTGGFSEPTLDATQNWTLVSNTVESGVRTVVATRALNTGDSNDYVFTNSANSITLVYARGTSLVVDWHGNNGCGTTTSNLVLGLEDFSLNASQVYPNPSNGNFTIKTKTALNKINVYTQTGAFVKTIDVNNTDSSEVNVSGIATGIYLIELQNDSEKSWKKVIIN